MMLPACNSAAVILQVEESELLAAEAEAADDIMFTPGGYVYRANLHQQGEVNPWVEIETRQVTLAADDGSSLYLRYRDHIITGAGESRNNIFAVILPEEIAPDENAELNLYAADVPSGIEVTESMRWHGFRAVSPVLVFTMPADLKAGLYSCEISIEINGKDYGKAPCVIEVVGHTISE